MENVALGTQGLTVSRIGLGCMGMSFGYGDAPRERSVATLHRAVEQGITLYDTADMYGPETNEELLGDVLGPYRDQVVFATKFGNAYAQDDRAIDGRPDYVRSCCDASLRRLGTDHIDLYYQHRVDPLVPIEETVGAMAELVQAGKVRYLGLSEAAPETIRRAHAVHPISAVQSEYSLWTRDPEVGVIPTLRELGIGLVPYSPLGRGFLTGRIAGTDQLAADDHRRLLPRLQQDNIDLNRNLVARLEDIAKSLNITSAQLALAWVLNQGDDVVPIPGTTRPERIDEHVDATTVQLSAETRAELDALFPRAAAAGERLPEALMEEIDPPTQ